MTWKKILKLDTIVKNDEKVTWKPKADHSVSNAPKEWVRHYKENDANKDKPPYNYAILDMELQNVEIIGEFRYRNRGHYIDDIKSHIDDIVYDLRIKFEHDVYDDDTEHDMRVEGGSYDTIDETIEVSVSDAVTGHDSLLNADNDMALPSGDHIESYNGHLSIPNMDK